MRLSAFIKNNIERISAEWEEFAATLLPDQKFSRSVLRDGIVDILSEITRDMNRAQSARAQKDKSEGEPGWAPDIDEAAERHALARLKMGLSSRQMISEFRALRATVIRLWQEGAVEVDEASLYDLTRFNEAIDQILSEAAARYSEEIERSRDLFLGILGHDLRNPLAAIVGWAELQMRNKVPANAPALARQIFISAGRMSHMITDLTELTRVRLGDGIVVNRSTGDLRAICASVILEMEAIYPDREFRLTCIEALPGDWDGVLLAQVMSNLLGNAVQHGAADSAITLSARREGDWVELAVHNEGAPIPEALIPRLFDRLFQGAMAEGDDFDQSTSVATSLGLGLYIAREIVLAHGGTLDVTSDAAAGTNFTTRMPWADAVG